MQFEQLIDLVSYENSKNNTLFVGNILHEKPEFVPRLWEVFLSNIEPTSRRVAWVLDTASENNPEWVIPYLPGLIDKLPAFRHDGLKRHALHMISRSPTPGEKQGDLLNYCFECLLSPAEAVAAKVYSISILYCISCDIPEIKRELIDTIEFQMPEATPGFRSYGSKILAKLYREIRP